MVRSTAPNGYFEFSQYTEGTVHLSFTVADEFGEAADWRELWRFIQTLPQ